MTLLVLDERATGFSGFRLLPNGRGRAYTIAEAPIKTLRHTLRIAEAVGYATRGDDDLEAYAVLDVMEGDDVVQDFVIPHARAFRWWYRVLGLRVASQDDDT